MATLYQKVKAKLEAEPQFRERRFRGEFLAEMALESTNLLDGYRRGNEFDLKELSDYADTYSSLQREWRKCLEENESLRGSDYLDKTALSQEKQISLGYEIGYKKDIKRF